MSNRDGDMVLASTRLLTRQDHDRLSALLQMPVTQILVSSPWIRYHLTQGLEGTE